MYQGNEFPCLEGCPVVTQLPHLSVGDYLEGQLTAPYEKAQDAYLELMQLVADVAFELLLDTDLPESVSRETLVLWHKMGHVAPEELANRIGPEWMDELMLPAIEEEDPLLFAQIHQDRLLAKANKEFGTLASHQACQDASVFVMGVALHLARGLGAAPDELVEHWIETAQLHGGVE